MTTAQQNGYDFARGVVRYLGRCFLLGLVIVGAFALLRNSLGWGVDDTDRDGWNRSGLRLHTDYRTGVQYVATPDGALTPRLGPDGKPLTRYDKDETRAPSH